MRSCRAADPEPYAELRAALTDEPFVDMQKLYIGRGRSAAPEPEVDADAIPGDDRGRASVIWPEEQGSGRAREPDLSVRRFPIEP